MHDRLHFTQPLLQLTLPTMTSRFRRSVAALLFACLPALVGPVGAPARAAAPGLGGVKVSLARCQGAATVSANLLDRFKLRVQVDRNGETQPLAVSVELPDTGQNAWPVNDVEVRDESGQALLVERAGIEWAKLLIPLPHDVRVCTVQAVEPAGGRLRRTSEQDRLIEDPASGARVRIANWPEGRTAALSIRFDDSHPTHLSKAIPILREYGFRGTFMVNPGPKEPGSRANYAFQTQHAEWESVMRQGDQELANHSAHHRGAKGDEDMDAEIGTAARAIRELTPGRSKLMALNLGGGTRWATTRTLRDYLDKHHQFDASGGSLGMDDSYGGRVEAFRKALELHLKRGLWCRVHYHGIGDGLGSSEANFRAALEVARQHQNDLWIAGMADIYKYQTERDSAKLSLVKSDASSLTFQLDCATDATLYDQPLAIELISPTTWPASKARIENESGAPVAAKVVQSGGRNLLRIEVPPIDGAYTFNTAP